MNPNASSNFAHQSLRVPRIELPGVDRTAVAELEDLMTAGRRLRIQYSLAMVRLGKHIHTRTISAKDKAARRKTGKAQRTARKAHR